MSIKYRLLSLLLAALMTAAAALTVNKTLFGRRAGEPQKTTAETVDNPAVSAGANGEIVIHSSQVPGVINGYAGPVPVDIRIVDGKITEVRPLENTETPGFFARASAVCESWLGLTPEQALETKVDAVSGATYSSAAIINNVNASLSYYQGIAEKPVEETPWKLWIAFAVTLAACVVPLMVRSRIYHTVQLIANVAVLGFWCGQYLGYSLILKYTSYGFSGPAALIAVLMLVSAFVYPVFGRTQHYCTFVCPLGAAQQLMGKIFGYKVHLSHTAVKVMEWVRRGLWAALLLLLWADTFTEWMNYELFGAFSLESASWGVIAAAIAVLMLSLVIVRPYCRFICPTGSLIKRSENLG